MGRLHAQWANVEVFEIWPRSCVPTQSQPCHGRHPAPFDRIRSQLANEAAVLEFRQMPRIIGDGIVLPADSILDSLKDINSSAIRMYLYLKNEVFGNNYNGQLATSVLFQHLK